MNLSSLADIYSVSTSLSSITTLSFSLKLIPLTVPVMLFPTIPDSALTAEIYALDSTGTIFGSPILPL